ncbi:MAG: exopolyphosphatase [Defluviitaleaceae bacterium]|nr:exopolyphosphatase [Defluviitaleaceae bacterium]
MRLLTRSDFDGLACGALLKAFGIIDSWQFVHPKDMQDGLVEVTSNDVLANVPYVEGCGMWFDHHTSEEERVGWDITFEGRSYKTDSAARVIYDYYNGTEILPEAEDFVAAVDKVDAGKLSIEDIQNPTGWVLLGFLMDPRTGLGRFRDFRISNYDLMAKLIDDCIRHTADEILADPDIAERVALYNEQTALFKKMIEKHTTVHKNVIVTDLRGVETIYTGNRFMIYSMYPEQNVSMWIVDGRAKQNVSIATGYSILNRSCTVNIGSLMLKHGGGGHPQVGTCQVPYDDADNAINDIIAALQA